MVLTPELMCRALLCSESLQPHWLVALSWWALEGVAMQRVVSGAGTTAQRHGRSGAYLLDPDCTFIPDSDLQPCP